MADAHARNHCLECRPNSSELEIGFGRDLCARVWKYFRMSVWDVVYRTDCERVASWHGI
jgi:hypothetical protein